jgi:hypothetical protein
MKRLGQTGNHLAQILSTAWLVGVWYLTAPSYTARVLNFIAIVFFISTGLMVNCASGSAVVFNWRPTMPSWRTVVEPWRGKPMK